MREDAEFVPLVRQIGLVAIRYQAYTAGFEGFPSLLEETLNLKELLANEYSTLGRMSLHGNQRNETICDKNNTSGSTDSDDGRRMGRIGQNDCTQCPECGSIHRGGRVGVRTFSTPR